MEQSSSPSINPLFEPLAMKISHRFLPLLGAMPHFGAWAHDGHGLSGAHWHAWDALGFAAAIVVGVAAWYLGNRK